VTDALEDLQLVGATVEIALDRLARHRPAEEVLDANPYLFDPQVSLGFSEDLNNGGADRAELTPAIWPWPVGLWGSFPLFTPRLTCETLE
jgi:hypothetical protein